MHTRLNNIQEEPDDVNPLIEWASNNRCYISQSIEIKSEGVFALKDIPINTTLMTVNNDVLIENINVDKLDIWIDNDTLKLLNNKFTINLIKLLYAENNEINTPYLNSIPKDYEDCALMDALSNEKEYERYSYMKSLVKSYKAVKNCLMILSKYYKLLDYDEDKLRWAFITVVKGMTAHGLIPVMDKFNHSNFGSKIQKDKRECSVQSTRAYKKGEQVYINYGLLECTDAYIKRNQDIDINILSIPNFTSNCGDEVVLQTFKKKRVEQLLEKSPLFLAENGLSPSIHIMTRILEISRINLVETKHKLDGTFISIDNEIRSLRRIFGILSEYKKSRFNETYMEDLNDFKSSNKHIQKLIELEKRNVQTFDQCLRLIYKSIISMIDDGDKLGLRPKYLL